jgi:IS1 family transposase
MREYPRWRWHLDEAFVKVKGKLCYLWRAVDHEGEVLKLVVTAKRDKAAALRFLKRIMKKYGRPWSVVTDGLCSYPASMKEIGGADRHEVGRPLNNCAENSNGGTLDFSGVFGGWPQRSIQIGDPSPQRGDLPHQLGDQRARWPPHAFFRSNRSTSDGRTASTGLCARLHGA